MAIIPEFWIKQHDKQPYYHFAIIDARGDALNLIGAEIRFTMKNLATGVKVIDRTTVGIEFDDEAGGDDRANGKGHYEWQAGDTDNTGKFSGEFEITPISGGKFTKPVRDSLIVNIKADVDGV